MLKQSVEVRSLNKEALFHYECMQVISRVSDPYSFFQDPDPDPAFEAGDQSGSGSGSNPDPGL